MKLVRYGKPGKEKPGLIDADGKIRDLSGVIDDIGPAQLSPKVLARLAKIKHDKLPKVRGTPHNTGDGLKLAFELGAQPHGLFEGCHATPMDLHMADYGNLDLPHLERKHYRKICYFLGVMLNARGKRFVDEGVDFRNYTYA